MLQFGLLVWPWWKWGPFSSSTTIKVWVSFGLAKHWQNLTCQKFCVCSRNFIVVTGKLIVGIYCVNICLVTNHRLFRIPNWLLVWNTLASVLKAQKLFRIPNWLLIWNTLASVLKAQRLFRIPNWLLVWNTLASVLKALSAVNGNLALKQFSKLYWTEVYHIKICRVTNQTFQDPKLAINMKYPSVSFESPKLL